MVNIIGWMIHKHLIKENKLQSLEQMRSPIQKIAITSTHAKNYKKEIQRKQKWCIKKGYLQNLYITDK